jgi:Icc-related predicted phosphoesterase
MEVIDLIMKKDIPVLLIILFSHFAVFAQIQPPATSSSQEMYFVSDTQQPMLVEKIILKPNHNLKATADIFAAILKNRPKNLYMLGDVVGLGYADHKWKKVDKFLDSCRKDGTDVCAVLGNHEVMGRAKKGERNFQKRFPMNVSTGYVSVSDSVAVVLLNSNFNALSGAEEAKQQEWYKATMDNLDLADSIKAVIVCCHHAPYTNSKIVNCSNKVQEHFVPAYIRSKKAQLFITGHAHAFEHFKISGKDFLVIGGGGGLHQPLNNTANSLPDLAPEYKPMFHYLSVKRVANELFVTSHFLKNDFSGFDTGISFNTSTLGANVAITNDADASLKNLSHN